MKSLFFSLLMLAIGAPLAHAGVGAQYGTRKPQTCPSTAAPQTGPISATTAARYVSCRIEGVDHDGVLMLTENMKVQVGSAVPLADIAPQDRPDDAKVGGSLYPIRGSYELYICEKASKLLGNLGKNCSTFDNARATGSCYRTAFGDWKCYMTDLNAKQHDQQPPPAA